MICPGDFSWPLVLSRRLPGFSCVQLPTPRSRLVLVTEMDSDVTVSGAHLLLNCDYSWLTADFCRKSPTSGLRKPCSWGTSYARVSWQGSVGEGQESSMCLIDPSF